MKMKIHAIASALLLAAALVACGKDGTSESSGISGASWKATETGSAAGGEKIYMFLASGSWTVRSDQPSWCEATPSSGAAGKAAFTIKTTANETGALRTATITVSVNGHGTPAQFRFSQPEEGSGGSGSDSELNRMVDEYLVVNYLWNSDYKQLRRDLSLDYIDQNRNFLKTTLLGMTTNTLDKKLSASGNYRVYSYLLRTDATTPAAMNSRSGVNHPSVQAKKEYNFGIAGITIASYKSGGKTYYMFAVSAVYPSSPAAEAGIARGTLIQKVDNAPIDASNFEELYTTLLAPASARSVDLSIYQGQPVQLTAQLLYPTPVLYEEVIGEGAHKIGYLVYHSFDAAYDDDLLDAVARFKQAGITDLILDLRNNGGGHVITSNMLSTCIAGSACDGKVYEYYRFNDDRMADPKRTERDTGHEYDQTVKKFYETFDYGDYYGVDLRQYALDLKRLYVLTTGSTASSSEAVINSLRGIGVDVVLVGERTEGKNVGMEVNRFTVDNYTYELAPITFQGYNARQESVDPSGLGVDLNAADWNNGYVDFGQRDEPLLATALQAITGKTYRKASATRTGAVDATPVADLVLPPVPGRPRGMLLLPAQPAAQDEP